MRLVPLKNILFRLYWVFLLFLGSRLLFHVVYSNHFENAGLWEYWVGLLFDGSSFSHLFGVYLLFEILSVLFHTDFFQKLALFFYVLGCFILLSLQGLDLVYFSFTLKRTTSDVLGFAFSGGDLWQLIPRFIWDYAYLFCMVLLLTYVSYRVFLWPLSGVKCKAIVCYGVFILFFPAMILLSRGGTQLKPITVISASKYVKSSHTSLVLNTPFTLFTTLFEPTVHLPEYFASLQEAEKLYNPVKNYTGTLQKRNVVLIIVESLSQEYMGSYGAKKSYTPFLDSLAQVSTSFSKAFANGKRSIEALPAIISGMPTLMEMPVIYSPFATNQFGSIAHSLKKQGYASQFYHGGRNGTMGFEEYCLNAGFDAYVGMNEYPEKKDYDGNWGIFDEPFLQYMAQDLSKLKPPFFAGVFTLSSHHPYTIPKQHIGKFPKGTLPIHETIGYVDYALQRFFETAATLPWFEESIFILTADHTAQLEQANIINEYAIPLLIFDPKDKTKKQVHKVVQQADIYASIIDMLGISDSIISYGNSVFDTTIGQAVMYRSGNYQLIYGDTVLIFNGEKATRCHNYQSDTTLSINLADSINSQKLQELKAMIDSYGKRLRHNALIVE